MGIASAKEPTRFRKFLRLLEKKHFRAIVEPQEQYAGRFMPGNAGLLPQKMMPPYAMSVQESAPFYTALPFLSEALIFDICEE